MAFQGNAFALLGGDDAEILIHRVSTATEVPPSAVDKRNSLTSSHEKLGYNNSNGLASVERHNRERSKANNGKHNRNGANSSNGVERYNRNGARGANNGREQKNRGPTSKSNNEKASNGWKTKEEEEGWVTVGRPKHNADHRRPSRNGNASNASLEDKLNVDSDSKDLEQGDVISADQDEVLVSKKEIERLELEAKKSAELEAKKLERELDAKKMTLKQYEKLLVEKRKVLESMKTEERSVALETDFNSMHVIRKKNQQEPNFAKLNDKGKKKASNKDENNSFVLSQSPAGGRLPRRDHYRNGASSDRQEASKNHPDAPRSVGDPSPPSFEDAQHFPALALDGTH